MCVRVEFGAVARNLFRVGRHKFPIAVFKSGKMLQSLLSRKKRSVR